MDPNSLAETLLAQAAEAAARARLPESTYRLQLHAGFTFRDATAIVPYLRDLGITHAYASPYLKARPGSTHGYDIVDHGCLNPEIGTEEEYEAWVAALRERRDGPGARHRPQPHGRRHQRERLVERRPGERPGLPLRLVLRHLLARLAPPGAPGQGPAGGPGRPLRRRPRGRPAPAGLRRRGVLDPLLRPPVPGVAAQLCQGPGAPARRAGARPGPRGPRDQRIPEHPDLDPQPPRPQRDRPRPGRGAPAREGGGQATAVGAGRRERAGARLHRADRGGRSTAGRATRGASTCWTT